MRQRYIMDKYIDREYGHAFYKLTQNIGEYMFKKCMDNRYIQGHTSCSDRGIRGGKESDGHKYCSCGDDARMSA